MIRRSPTVARRSNAAEAAWTLLELLIAMVLLAVAIAMVTGILLGALGASGHSRAGAISDGAIARATAALSDDVARAETQGRSEGLLRDAEELGRAVRTGGQPASSDPGTPGPVDIDDVVTATSSLLHLRVDVAPQPGAECVEWRAAVAGDVFSVTRTVRAAGCTGTVLDRRVQLKARASVAGVDPTPFTYEMVCHRTLCGPESQAQASAPCRPWIVDSATDAGPKVRRWIVGVRASFTAVATEGRSAGRTAGLVDMTIRSRDTELYRGALGC